MRLPAANKMKPQAKDNLRPVNSEKVGHIGCKTAELRRYEAPTHASSVVVAEMSLAMEGRAVPTMTASSEVISPPAQMTAMTMGVRHRIRRDGGG